MTCYNCKFWRAMHTKDHGECRINPPAVMNNSGTVYNSSWPITGRKDWCGQYKERPSFSDHAIEKSATGEYK